MTAPSSSNAGSRLLFARADATDLDAVCALLGAEGLPTEDVAVHLPDFIVARDGDRLVAVVGLEPLGTAALLRSLCVTREYRGAGLGGALCDRISALARSGGARELYLLTTTARAFFERRGFVAIARDAVAEEIRTTLEFRSLCPASAVCMRRSLAHDPA